MFHLIWYRDQAPGRLSWNLWVFKIVWKQTDSVHRESHLWWDIHLSSRPKVSFLLDTNAWHCYESALAAQQESPVSKIKVLRALAQQQAKTEQSSSHKEASSRQSQLWLRRTSVPDESVTPQPSHNNWTLLIRRDWSGGPLTNGLTDNGGRAHSLLVGGTGQTISQLQKYCPSMEEESPQTA